MTFKTFLALFLLGFFLTIGGCTAAALWYKELREPDRSALSDRLARQKRMLERMRAEELAERAEKARKAPRKARKARKAPRRKGGEPETVRQARAFGRCYGAACYQNTAAR